MSEKKKNKASQQETATEETTPTAQAETPEQEGQPAAPAEDFSAVEETVEIEW